MKDRILGALAPRRFYSEESVSLALGGGTGRAEVLAVRTALRELRIAGQVGARIVDGQTVAYFAK